MPQSTIPHFTIILLIFIYSCAEKEKTEEIDSVEGSWNLIEYVDYGNNEEWTSYGDTIMYQKHITPNSFVWMNYDKKNERLIGTGGGTYDYIDGEYTEYIAFFYPPIESLIGQPIPFEAKFKDGKWYHTGYFVNKVTDPISSEVIQTDTVKIREIWEKTAVTDNKDLDLVGTWKLQKFRENADEPYTEFPEFHGAIKLITPTHFTWIQYDRHGDEVYATGSGTYSIDDDGYTEEIHMIYPENTGQIGESIKFQYEINDNQWYHYGFVPSVRIESGNIVKDSSLIDEYWVPYKISDVKELLIQ